MGVYSIDDGQDNPWRWRSKLAYAIGIPAPLVAAGAALAVGLGIGHMTRGCADLPCLTDGQRGETLGPNFDWDGGTVRGTPILQQKVVYTASLGSLLAD
jgi:hypothetical protein